MPAQNNATGKDVGMPARVNGMTNEQTTNKQMAVWQNNMALRTSLPRRKRSEIWTFNTRNLSASTGEALVSSPCN